MFNKLLVAAMLSALALSTTDVFAGGGPNGRSASGSTNSMSANGWSNGTTPNGWSNGIGWTGTTGGRVICKTAPCPVAIDGIVLKGH